MALYSIPNVQLSSGNLNMPLLGLGTASFPAVGSETVGKDSTGEYEVIVKAVVEAIRLGYRHFDTAAIYGTEPALGEAVAEALRLGLIQSRAELFITSKLWCSDAHAQYVLPALQNTLRNLKLEYLDLYLVHFPVSLKHEHGNLNLPRKENLVPMEMESVWSAMEECQALGLTKSIGVSNFSCKKLQDILAFAKIPPAVNQVEMNPLWQQKKLIEFCKANGILLAAYSPLGAAGTIYGSNRVMECEVLKEIAKAKGKTVAQVCLRWAHEQGGAVVVKSFNKERLKQNLEIFDWGLSDEESKKISVIPQSRIVSGEGFVSANGPFKSIEEFWDGEL